MNCVASRFGYPNYRLSELTIIRTIDYPNYRLSEISLVTISSDNRRSSVFLLAYCMALQLVYLSKHGGESNLDFQQERQCTYNTTLRGVRATIIAVEKE